MFVKQPPKQKDDEWDDEEWDDTGEDEEYTAWLNQTRDEEWGNS